MLGFLNVITSKAADYKLFICVEMFTSYLYTILHMPTTSTLVITITSRVR